MEESQIIFPRKYLIFFSETDFVLANSADQTLVKCHDANVAFNFGLHFLQKYLLGVSSLQYLM